MTDALPPEIHHIADAARSGSTLCGIDMPPEQLDVRARGKITVCLVCSARFKGRRPKRGTL